NNLQAARRRFEAILEKDKDNVQILLTLANLAGRIGATPQEQAGWLERARNASKGSLQSSLMLARFYAQAGEPKKALEAAQQAQAISPDNLEMLETLGSIQMASG